MDKTDIFDLVISTSNIKLTSEQLEFVLDCFKKTIKILNLDNDNMLEKGSDNHGELNEGKTYKDLAVPIGYTMQYFEKQREFEKILLERNAFDICLDDSSKEFIIDYFNKKYEQTPEQIVVNYIKKVNNWSFLGGYGHQFVYSGVPHGYSILSCSPPHWVINPKKYKKVTPTDDEMLAMKFYQIEFPYFKCCISPEADFECWDS